MGQKEKNRRKNMKKRKQKKEVDRKIGEGKYEKGQK